MDDEVKILFVDDERNVLRSLERLFLDEEYEIITANSGQEGLDYLEEEGPVQIVVSDYRMPEMNGVDFLRKVIDRWPETIRMVLSGYADTAAVVAAVNDGHIYKFIPKPWNDDELKVTVDKAIESYFLFQKNKLLTNELQDSNEELKLLNENLEKLVEERTSELLFQNRVLTRSQIILDSLPVGVFGVAPDGMIVQCNQAGCNALDEDYSTLLTQDSSSALPDTLVDILNGLEMNSKSDTTVELEGKNIRVLASVMDSGDGQEGKILVLVPGKS